LKVLKTFNIIIVFEGWKGQNPSKTFKLEGSFVENLRLEGYNSRPGLACGVHLMSSLPLALGQLILFWQPRHSPIFVVSL